MISNYEVKKFLESKRDDNSFPFYEKEDKIFDKENHQEVCSFDLYMKYLREKLHCSFEIVYYCHASLTEILRCTECGAIIFTGDDERYDPNLCCPVCSNYNHGDYWTKEEIEQDPEKQEAIKFYEKWMKEEAEAEKRRIARGGLYDWQVFKKDYYGKKHSIHIELTKSYGYTFEFYIGTKDKGELGYTVKKFYKIPLSPKSFYIICIYPFIKFLKKEGKN